MRSPFPGMDPFIESFGLWEDFHSKLIGEMERTLSSVVPDRYVVRTGERSYVAIGSPSGDEGQCPTTTRSPAGVPRPAMNPSKRSVTPGMPRCART